jgi:hypothetical protein
MPDSPPSLRHYRGADFPLASGCQLALNALMNAYPFSPFSCGPNPESNPGFRALDRRSFLRQSLVLAGGCACCLQAGNLFAVPDSSGATTLISPGCRRSKVKVAKLYLGVPKAHWPTPIMDLDAEVKRYETAFAGMNQEFAAVQFVVNQAAKSVQDINALQSKLQAADGILLIHISMGLGEMVREVLAAKRPTVLFAAP